MSEREESWTVLEEAASGVRLGESLLAVSARLPPGASQEPGKTLWSSLKLRYVNSANPIYSQLLLSGLVVRVADHHGHHPPFGIMWP